MQSPVLRGSPGSLNGLLERERLFAAILDEARSYGYRGASVEAVAMRAGVSEACFHAHFGSTEECLLAALHGMAMRAHAQGLLCAAGGPEEEPMTDRMIDPLNGREHESRVRARGVSRGAYERERAPSAESAVELAEERLGRVLGCLAPILTATVTSGGL